jgi:hypothetical protein
MFTKRLAIFLVLISPFSNNLFAKSVGEKLCHESPDYFCYVVARSDTWKKLFPDEEERDIIMRINRRNQIHAGVTLAIPKSDSLNMLDYSPFPLQIESTGSKLIKVSLKDLAFGAYSAEGALQYWGPISSGKGYCPDVGRRCSTPPGHYSIQSKQGPGCVSTKFPVGRGGAPMPYCMFFYRGYALHGSPDLPGYHASHGCIRLLTKDAKWLNQDFTPGSYTAVIVSP